MLISLLVVSNQSYNFRFSTISLYTSKGGTKSLNNKVLLILFFDTILSPLPWKVFKDLVATRFHVSPPKTIGVRRFRRSLIEFSPLPNATLKRVRPKQRSAPRRVQRAPVRSLFIGGSTATRLDDALFNHSRLSGRGQAGSEASVLNESIWTRPGIINPPNSLRDSLQSSGIDQIAPLSQPRYFPIINVMPSWCFWDPASWFLYGQTPCQLARTNYGQVEAFVVAIVGHCRRTAFPDEAWKMETIEGGADSC